MKQNLKVALVLAFSGCTFVSAAVPCTPGLVRQFPGVVIMPPVVGHLPDGTKTAQRNGQGQGQGQQCKAWWGRAWRCWSCEVHQRRSKRLLRCQWNDMKESLHNCMNEAMKQWTDEPVNEFNEPMKQWSNKLMNQWFNDWMSQWSNESVNQRINGWTTQWVNEPTN